MFVVYDLGVLIPVLVAISCFVCLGALGCQYTRVVFHSLSLRMFKLFGLHFVKIKDRVDNN